MTSTVTEKLKKELKEKIENKMHNDPKYNMIMKLAHKITDKENYENIKKLISEDSAVILDKAIKSESKFLFI
jgi:hypothetical protein